MKYLIIFIFSLLLLSCESDNLECNECHHLSFIGSTFYDTLETMIYCNELCSTDTNYVFISKDYWSCD